MFSFRRSRAARRQRRTTSRYLGRRRLTVETLEARALPSFSAPINTPVGTDPVAVAVGDFNGDGLPDAAVADHGSSTAAGDLRVLLGNGDGTFVSGGAYRVGAGPIAVGVGDVDGDGTADIVVASTVSPAGFGGQIAALLGNGDGTFRPPVFMQLVGAPTALAAVDYNGDGLVDLLVGEVGDGRTTGIYVLLGNGDGTFQQGAHFPLLNNGRPTAVAAIGDADGDGLPDVAATAATPTAARGLVAVWLSGDSSLAPHLYRVGINPSSIVAADFSGDFVTDLAVANMGANTAPGSVSILYGNGDGTFQDAVDFRAGPAPTNLALGDFNADGLPDLAATNPVPTTVRGGVAILYGDGQGGFSTPEFYRADVGPTGVAVGDFDGNGLDDLIVTNVYSNDVSVLLQQADSAAAGLGNSYLRAAGHDAQAGAAARSGVALRAAEDDYFPLLAGETTGHRKVQPAALVRSLVTLRPDLLSLDLEAIV